MTVGLRREVEAVNQAVVTETSEPLGTCPAYFAEMADYGLITAEEEQQHTTTIRESFRAIIESCLAVQVDVPELHRLQRKLRVYCDQDPAFTPKNRLILQVGRQVDEMFRLYPELRVVQELWQEVGDWRARLEEAKQIMVNSNLRLVVSIARFYVNRDMAFGDVIQEGNIGLMRAVFRFDPSRGNRFSTYATWWIKQSITRALMDKTRTIRLPIHFVEKQKQYYRTAQALRVELQRDPLPSEVARRADIPLDRVHELLLGYRETLSLDTPACEDSEASLKEFVADSSERVPEERMARTECGTQIQKLLSTLNVREQLVLTLRFGLDGQPERTLADIGRDLQISRERVRQIAQQALGRLRHPSRLAIIEDYQEEGIWRES